MRAAFFALALSTLAACAGPPPVGRAAEIPGTTWSVERIVSADGDVDRASETDQVSFGPEGSLSLSSCNLCSGRYAVADSVLTVEPGLACTRRACAPGAIELERHLEGTSVLRRDGVYLVIEPDSLDEQILLVPAEL